MKRSLFLALILLSGFARSQQYPETQLYMVNPYLINPGFTGYLTDLSAYAGVMSPLVMDDNVIRNYQVGINKSIEKIFMGIGGKMTYDQRDFFKSIYMDASFSYRMVTNKDQVLSVGADVGLVNRTYDIAELSPLVDLRDPTLYSEYYFKTNFKLGFGLAYYSTKIEAGIAMPHMVEGSEQFNGYFNSYFAYKLYFDNDVWMAKPNAFFINYPDGTYQFQGNIMIAKRGVFWGQLGATNQTAITGAIGVIFNRDYEFVFSHQRQLDNDLPYGSRSEVMIRVHMGKSRRILSHVGAKRNRKE